MSIERKQFLVWLAMVVVFGAGTKVLMQTHPELFGPDRPAVYRLLPVVKAVPEISLTFPATNQRVP
jgi:hypothetical protein